MDDSETIEKANSFANTNKKDIARRYTDMSVFVSEAHPVSVFMAGSPGAGKTESARALIQRFTGDGSILHIDADELRGEFEDYNGTNSSLFQAATSILVDKIHDFALKNKQSFVFDGTFSNLAKGIQNIERSLDVKRGREVFIMYVYQDPVQAWEFVKKRAEKDGRIVPKEAFVAQYFAARANVNKVKEKFKDNIQVDLIEKNIDGTNLRYKENISVIDNHIKEKYSETTLIEQLV